MCKAYSCTCKKSGFWRACALRRAISLFGAPAARNLEIRALPGTHLIS